MKKGKYFIIGGLILVAVFLFYKVNFVDCIGCGGCSYSNFTDTVSLQKIDFKNDTIYEFHFKSKLNTPNKTYRLSESEIPEPVPAYELISLKNSNQLLFEISGEHIINGTCAPYFITSLKVLVE